MKKYSLDISAFGQFPERSPYGAGARKGGFSLLEVVVAVMIVAVLALLLFPAISGALQKGRQAQCVANLRQIGSLMHLYLAEHQGQFPLCFDAEKYRFWPQEITESAGVNDVSAFICPEVKNIHPVLAARNGGLAYVSYAINNIGLAPASTDRFASGPARLSSIEEPAKVLMILDYDDPRQPYDGWYEATQTVMKLEEPQLSKRHNGSINALFCDGHVEALDREKLLSKPAGDLPWAERRYLPWR